MTKSKQSRMMEVFFRGMLGEHLSVAKLADEYGVSSKSISRDISEIKCFLAEHRDIVGYAELEYNYHEHTYNLKLEEFLSSKEMFALVKIVLGSRALSKSEALTIIDKIKRFTTANDRQALIEMIRRELYHYNEVHHDCSSVQDNLWRLVELINKQKEITIKYYKVDHSYVERRIRPVTIMFSEYYFYLIAFNVNDETRRPSYFRIDRIVGIVEHRNKLAVADVSAFDEGALREKIQYMWPGKLQVIRFEYSGPSVQAILDKMPTARIIERKKDVFLIEAETFGVGIKMFLLSQGCWVKVVSPEEFVSEMRGDILKMSRMYE